MRSRGISRPPTISAPSVRRSFDSSERSAVDENHPELVGKLSRGDFLAMAEEE